MKRLNFLHMLFVASLAISSLVLTGCGDESTINAVINGKKVSLSVDGVDIVAGGIAGPIQGASGVPISGKSLSILIRFFFNNTLNTIRYDIADVTVIAPGQTYYADQANIQATMTFQNVNAYVPPGTSIIQFDEIGAADGQSVSFNFQIQSPTGIFEGHASGSVKLGF